MDAVELVPGVYHLPFPVGHAYLWARDDGLTLIDSGLPGSAAGIAEAIRGLGREPAEVTTIVLTHFHDDHVGGAPEIAAWGPVTIMAGRADAPVVRGEAAGPPPILSAWEVELLQQVRAGMGEVKADPVRVDRELAGGEVLPGGAHVLAAPGHTPGSVALYLPGPGVLFAGDAVARTSDGRVIRGVFNADPERAEATFQMLAALDVRVACFGHGDPLTEDAATLLRAAASGK